MIMKKILFFIAAAAFVMACDPLEDQTLRNQYVINAGEPISVADLTKALKVTQPYPNQDGVVEGDQIIVVENTRTDIGGAWHFVTPTGDVIIKSDKGTYSYTANGEFEVFFKGISANQIVESQHIPITVTNAFDPYNGIITGAKNKADVTAKRTWTWRQVDNGSICNMGAHGGWKYTSAGYVPESDFIWWASYNLETGKVGEEKMVFEFDGFKMTTYKPDGTVAGTGTFNVSHDSPEDLVLGILKTTTPTIGARFDDNGQGSDNSFYLLTFTDDYMTIYEKSGGMSDWDDCGWYAYFKSVKE